MAMGSSIKTPEESTSKIVEPDQAQRLALERFREYLLLLARMNLGEAYRSKLDASDIVQHAMLEAHRHRDYYRGKSDAELAGWLRQILATSLGLAVRALGKAKRDVHRERSLQAAVEASSARLENILAADQTSPSQNAQNQERVLQLAEALAQLPDSQREVLVLKHCQGWTLIQIAEHLQRSVRAVAGLLQRGTKQLRVILQEEAE